MYLDRKELRTEEMCVRHFCACRSVDSVFGRGVATLERMNKATDDQMRSKQSLISTRSSQFRAAGHNGFSHLRRSLPWSVLAGGLLLTPGTRNEQGSPALSTSDPGL